MGYIRHNAIIATFYERGPAEEFIFFAVSIGATVSEAIESPLNGYVSVFIAPDGSKEGWSDSAVGDVQRAAIIEYLDRRRYDDGSAPFDWVEVQYGDYDHVTKVVAHSDDRPASAGSQDPSSDAAAKGGN
jgi:hypothetical protein